MTDQIAPEVLTGDVRIDGLLTGFSKWSGTTITFSIATSASVWSAASYPVGNSLPYFPNYGIATPAQASQFRLAVATWASYIGMPVAEVNDDASSSGEIRLAFSVDPARPMASLGTYPGSGSGGDVWLNGNPAYASNYAVGTGYYQAMLHEIGHALGLKHPFDVLPSNGITLDTAHNNRFYTIMAYSAGGPTDGYTIFQTTPSVYDILAVQSLYGKNTTFNAGDTTYSFSSTGAYEQTIWDAGGLNTISYSGTKAGILDLREGQGSYLGQDEWVTESTTGKLLYTMPNVWIAFGTVIQNAVGGTGNDTFIGNNSNNVFTGGAGNDTMDGGNGTNTAVYSGKFSDYKLTVGTTTTVSDSRSMANNDGTDSLSNIQRLHFADEHLALDLAPTQAAGKAVLTMAATLGPAFVQDKTWGGVFLAYFDAGAAVLDATTLLVSAGIVAAFAGGKDNATFVKFIYSNVNGSLPDATTLAALVAPLDTHTVTQAQWMDKMAESMANQEHVHLTGYAQTGLQFV